MKFFFFLFRTCTDGFVGLFIKTNKELLYKNKLLLFLISFTYINSPPTHINTGDTSAVAKEIGCEFFPLFDIAAFSKIDFDVILLSVSIISFEEVLRSLPKNMLKGKLIVDVLSVKVSYRRSGRKRGVEGWNCDV